MAEGDPQLRFTNQQDISIAELKAAKADGFYVARSPHVGNLSPYNMALAAEGIPLLLVDQNLGGVDDTYYPELVISKAGTIALAEAGTVTARTLVEGDQAGRYLDEYHVDAIRDAIPDAEVRTITEYLREHEAISGEIIKLAATEMPGLFKRVVNADGTTTKDGARAVQLALAGNTMQLGDDPRAEVQAALVPNEVNIIDNIVAETLRTERDRQYQISGPAMAVYVHHAYIAESFQHLYALIKEKASFGDKLPQTVEVILIDATDARFATTQDQAEQLDGLVAAYDQMEADLVGYNQRRGSFFASDDSKQPDARAAFLTEMALLEDASRGATKAAIAEVPLALSDAHTAGFEEDEFEGFTSQYDVFALGGLYVAQANLDRTLAELSVMTKRMRKLASGGKV